MSQFNNEDYFQINTDILTSFSKYRPPLNLYVFREEISVLEPYYKKGTRLTDAKVEELSALCAAGMIFVARSDQNIYRKHMLQQLDLILLDEALSDAERAELCIAALVMRYKNYYEQPVPDIMEILFRDTMVVTEYLWNDKHRINAFMRRLFRKAKPARHAVNTMIVGTWLLLQKSGEMTRKEFDRTVFALLLHDAGMSKIPEFILAKRTKLTGEEMDKIMQHPITAVRMMQKSDLKFDEIVHACFEHHERLDGSGYPQRSKGNQISPVGRLTAVADSFSAMICERSYAPAKEPAKAANELMNDQRYDHAFTAKLATAYVPNSPIAEPVDMDSRLEELYKD